MFKKLIFKAKMKTLNWQSGQFYKQFMAEDQLSEELRKELIFQRVKRLISVAYEQTTFYHDLYHNIGFEPNDLKSMKDFEKLPVIDKTALRESSEEMISRNCDRKSLRIVTTGGSTGEPVIIYHDKNLPINEISWWLLGKWGCHISDNCGFLQRYVPPKETLNYYIWWPTQRAFLSAAKMNDEVCDVFYHQCLKYKVRYLCGYVGAIEQFANFLHEKSLSLNSLQVVWTTAAPLTTTARTFMSSVYHVPVFSQYGCCEALWLGSECPTQEGIHYFDTIRHIEVVDESLTPLGNDQYGELLLTDLLNLKFPLIRYRNGDCVCKLSKKCSCGSNFPLLAPVRGRVTEMIHFPDNSHIAGDFLTTIFDDTPLAVKAFQVIQKKDFNLIVRYIPGAPDCADTVKNVCAKLQASVSYSGIHVSAEAVSEIKHDKGKTRFIISELEK